MPDLLGVQLGCVIMILKNGGNRKPFNKLPPRFRRRGNHIIPTPPSFAEACQALYDGGYTEQEIADFVNIHLIDAPFHAPDGA